MLDFKTCGDRPSSFDNETKNGPKYMSIELFSIKNMIIVIQIMRDALNALTIQLYLNNN